MIANHSYLEQRDFGSLLGKANRMSTYNAYTDPKDIENYGRAFCFYYPKDGTLRAISKLGYEASSTDEGKTWVDVPRAMSLKTGDAKVWVQKTSDGRYALTHNPQPTGKNRYPLVILSSEDGITFKDMRLLSGDFSDLSARYAGYGTHGRQSVQPRRFRFLPMMAPAAFPTRICSSATAPTRKTSWCRGFRFRSSSMKRGGGE